MYIFRRKNRLHTPDEIIQSSGTAGSKKLTHVQQFEFIRERFNGIGKDSMILSWMVRMRRALSHGFQSKEYVFSMNLSNFSLSLLTEFFLQHSFVKQFYASVTRSDYKTMRLGFIMVRIPQQYADFLFSLCL